MVVSAVKQVVAAQITMDAAEAHDLYGALYHMCRHVGADVAEYRSGYTELSPLFELFDQLDSMGFGD